MTKTKEDKEGGWFNKDMMKYREDTTIDLVKEAIEEIKLERYSLGLEQGKFDMKMNILALIDKMGYPNSNFLTKELQELKKKIKELR